MNHADGGFDCPGCAWADDPSGLKLDICENGIKHVTWELQPAKADRDFFATLTVSEMATLSDYDLEMVGRLAEPLLYNPETDKYEPVSGKTLSSWLAKRFVLWRVRIRRPFILPGG
jgi:hypothetical protein